MNHTVINTFMYYLPNPFTTNTIHSCCAIYTSFRVQAIISISSSVAGTSPTSYTMEQLKRFIHWPKSGPREILLSTNGKQTP